MIICYDNAGNTYADGTEYFKYLSLVYTDETRVSNNLKRWLFCDPW